METQMFDVAYYALSGLMLVLLSVTAVQSARAARSAIDGRRQSASAIAVAASGVLASLLVGVGLNAIRAATGDVFYQEVHFAVFFAGFGLVLWGANRLATATVTAPAPRKPGFGPVGRRIGWLGAYGLSVIYAEIKLVGDGIQPAQAHLPMPQHPVYFAPVLVALGLAVWATANHISGPRGARREVVGFAAFCLLVAVGFLREATIIPSFDEPLVDLALAFGPFTAGAFCLYWTWRAIAKVPTSTAVA